MPRWDFFSPFIKIRLLLRQPQAPPPAALLDPLHNRYRYKRKSFLFTSCYAVLTFSLLRFSYSHFAGFQRDSQPVLECNFFLLFSPRSSIALDSSFRLWRDLDEVIIGEVIVLYRYNLYGFLKQATLKYPFKCKSTLPWLIPTFSSTSTVQREIREGSDMCMSKNRRIFTFGYFHSPWIFQSNHCRHPF